jgi:hypothetical protein
MPGCTEVGSCETAFSAWSMSIQVCVPVYERVSRRKAVPPEDACRAQLIALRLDVVQAISDSLADKARQFPVQIARRWRIILVHGRRY